MTAPAAAPAGAEAAAGAGIAPRPEIDPEILAVLAAAVDQAWPGRVVVEDDDPPPPAWRFSGRWWSAPAMARRPRPRA